jgi:excisionase family DNA binding protein
MDDRTAKASDAAPPGSKHESPQRQLTEDRLWDAGDVARFLSVSRSMVYKLEQMGELPCVHIGARVRFEPAAVRAYTRGELRWHRDGSAVLLEPRRPR